jgi:hypothetical protein
MLRDEVIGTEGNSTVGFHRSDCEDGSICDLWYNFGKPHPAVILKVMKLEILHFGLRKRRD